MRLTDLDPDWLAMPRVKDGKAVLRRAESIEDARGIIFLCPKCEDLRRKVSLGGVHSIICWNPEVPQDFEPKPGRWSFQGSGFHDLTLKGTSSDSVNLEQIVDGVAVGCQAHFFIRGGAIE